MMEIVRRDLDRYLRHSAGDRRARVLAIATNCGLQAVLVYRFGRWLQRLQRAYWWSFPLVIPGWIAYALALLLTRYGYGIRVALSADIGPGLCIWHFGGIDVRDCTIGSNCAIAQQTKIGPAPGGKRTRRRQSRLVQPARVRHRRHSGSATARRSAPASRSARTCRRTC